MTRTSIKTTPTPLPTRGHVDYGQYRVTFTLYGPFAEIWIAECEGRAGHWRLVTQNRDRILRDVTAKFKAAA